MSRRGLTILEMVVGISLLSLVVIFVASLLPSSVGSLRRSEALQSATMYGMGLIEDARQNPPGTPFDAQVPASGASLHAVRQVLPAGNGLVDVQVTVAYRNDAPPVILATRLLYTPTPTPSPTP